jgi:hypothetical protein
MLILHAAFFENRLFVWGEIPVEPESRAHRISQDRSKSFKPPPLPYDAGPDKLSEALKEVGLGQVPGGLVSQAAVAWLPTHQRRPWASSPLIAEPPPGTGQVGPFPWQVTALALPPTAEVELLCACVNQEVLVPGVVIGKDLGFWAAALRFAGSLAARQRFLPGLKEIQGTYYACWEPVLSGADGGVAVRLAAIMPGNCRALTVDATAPPARPAAEVLKDFLGRIADHLPRFSASATQETAKIRSGRPAKQTSGFDSLHDQWLHALQAPDGLMVGGPGDLARLHNQIQQWRRPVSVTAAAPFRLCFRLEEPEEVALPAPGSPGAEPWFVRYLLQAAHDPSLLIPVQEAWNPGKRIAALLRAGEFHVQEYLLVSLGQSARLWPDIESGLQTALPEGQGVFHTHPGQPEPRSHPTPAAAYRTVYPASAQDRPQGHRRSA